MGGFFVLKILTTFITMLHFFNMKIRLDIKHNVDLLNKEKVRSYPISNKDIIEVKKCPICGNSKIIRITELYYQKNLLFFTTDVCNICMFVFRGISPSYRWFQKCWNIIKEKNPKPFNPGMEILRKRRYLKYYKLLKQFDELTTVLDIGAAFGSGSQVFKDRGYGVSVIEPDDNKTNYIKDKFELISKSIEKVKTKKKFDIVLFSNCLEHLDNPNIPLKQIRKLLSPKGLVCLEIPLINNYIQWSDAFYLTHKSNFSEQTILKLIQQEGFKVIKKAYVRQDRQHAKSLVLILKTGKYIRNNNFKNTDTIENIRSMYQIGSSIKSNDVLRYNIDKIEHFYYTFRLNEKKILITFI